VWNDSFFCLIWRTAASDSKKSEDKQQKREHPVTMNLLEAELAFFLSQKQAFSSSFGADLKNKV